MNPGAPEEVGKAVGSFMDTMKSQPLALALVVMNVGLLVLLYYVASTSAAWREKEFTMIMQSQKDAQILLSQCVPAGPRSGADKLKLGQFKLQSEDSHIVTLPPLADHPAGGEPSAQKDTPPPE